MANIRRLSNQTRADQRPPLLAAQASSLLITRLLPSARRPAAKRAQAQAARASQPAGSTARKKNRAFNAAAPPPSLRISPSQPTKFAPQPETPKNTRPETQHSNGSPPPRNGHSAVHNSPARNGQAVQQTDIFGAYVPVKPGRVENGDRQTRENNGAQSTKQTQPAPVEPEHGTRLLPAPPRPFTEQKEQAPAPPPQERKPEPHPANPTAPRGSALVPALQKLFLEQPDLPPEAAILGVGSDSIPVLLDLYDPTPGAMVIIGDEREEQLDILRSTAASLAARGTPRSVQFLIISCEPERWRKWTDAQNYQRFLIGIEGVEDLDNLRDRILRLGDWVEQRRTGQRSGPPIVVIFDTLSFLPRLSYDIRLNFEWMAKEGPAAQIWPIAAISSELAQMLAGRHMLRAFQTQVLGFVDHAEFYTQHAGLSRQDAESFAEPGVFAVQVGEGWLRMRPTGR